MPIARAAPNRSVWFRENNRGRNRSPPHHIRQSDSSSQPHRHDEMSPQPVPATERELAQSWPGYLPDNPHSFPDNAEPVLPQIDHHLPQLSAHAGNPPTPATRQNGIALKIFETRDIPANDTAGQADQIDSMHQTRVNRGNNKMASAQTRRCSVGQCIPRRSNSPSKAPLINRATPSFSHAQSDNTANPPAQAERAARSITSNGVPIIPAPTMADPSPDLHHDPTQRPLGNFAYMPPPTPCPDKPSPS